jgi:CDGSH-type Zn-finger protein
VRDCEGNAHQVTRPVVAVCVCGKSQRDPWCDGTHKVIPKDGQNTAQPAATKSPKNSPVA